MLIPTGRRLHRTGHLPKDIRLHLLSSTVLVLVAFFLDLRQDLDRMRRNLRLIVGTLGGLTIIVLNTLPVTRTDTGTAE